MQINKYKFTFDSDFFITGFYTVTENWDYEGQLAGMDVTNGWTRFRDGQFIIDEEKKFEILDYKARQERIAELKLMLSSQDSPYGDWKNLKQLDTGEYPEEEMAEYRAKRQEIREEIRELSEE